MTYGHDSAGNRSTENTRTYTYNQNNRLIQASDGATTLGQWAYYGFQGGHDVLMLMLRARLYGKLQLNALLDGH